MVRPPCCDKLNYKKRDRREEDGVKIIQYGSSGKGSSIPRKPESSLGMKKCGKNSKVRWSNNESFSPQEEELIIKLHAAVGSRWAIIAHQLPGRTDNDIKNHWNTKLRKKLTERGIDPITHKPFSQILADYGKIGGGLSRATTGSGSRYIGTIKSDLRKVATSFTLPKLVPSSSSTTSSYTFISNTQEYLSYENISTTTTTTTTTTNNSHSLDLLSQLQAITLVTEGTNCDKYQLPFTKSSSLDFGKGYDNEGKAVRSPDQSSFSWHDFLLDDSVKHVQEQEHQDQKVDEIGHILASTKPPQTAETGTSQTTDGYRLQGASSTAMSSQASSFLEAMLDQDCDMFLNFPGLMEDPLY